ncbi:BEL1-like homeodomain protein [Actinidia chinensis var. chinensis]|uniref:BEL1-like homeodomain protein n=1 Tax=Actinidia chinensis var. chinensis TaxID=1590841 RepID=A0A2R6RA38_ACTCC|nr:BEL1-like homeodomain protein [Actinidia chinensis var. chinensis]
MGTYFHGNSEIQGDGLQTLILMNPSYVNYSDAQPPPPPQGNFVFLNSAATGNSINPQNFSHAPPNQTQQFVGIPLSADPHHPSIHHHQHEISAVHGFIPRVPYNIYSSSIDHTTAAREAPRAQQGLSLSLSGGGGDEVRVSGGSPSSASGISNGVNGVQSVLLSSKYLKAAQELLDEVVNVGKGLKSESGKGFLTNVKSKASGESAAAAGEGASGGEPSGKRGGGELTPAERQEIQMKKAKLVNMLDEVEQRYRQYHHQMQIVISWFEQAAGIGSARTYTALALQTISRQFRCLKDAITGQIREASNNLGEENCFGGGKTEGSSRLKFVDHQIRQQRALQQLGMLQPNAWRPQRGLPERSVSVLRAWLFEHFLHPYPKDSDKIMLAKQTGLTRSQVSNWFINARVRLWKPMVEEMYVEETKEQEQNESEGKTSEGRNNEDSLPKSNSQKSPVTENQNRSFKSKQDNPTNQNTPSPISVSTASTSPTGISIRNQPGFTLIGSPVMEGFGQGSPKKQKSTEILQSPNSFSPRQVNVKPGEANTEQFSMRFGDERQRRDGGFTLMGAPTNFIEGFGSYSISEISRFGAEQFPYSGNGVSLTLGLPHCENLSMSGTHQTFLPNQTVEIGEENEFGTINTPTSSHSTSVYESINIQNRKRFAAQLLPDFVT